MLFALRTETLKRVDVENASNLCREPGGPCGLRTAGAEGDPSCRVAVDSEALPLAHIGTLWTPDVLVGALDDPIGSARLNAEINLHQLDHHGPRFSHASV